MITPSPRPRRLGGRRGCKKVGRDGGQGGGGAIEGYYGAFLVRIGGGV
jgi:hypothetical protein